MSRTVCPASHASGTVLSAARKPAVGIEIERRWYWRDRNGLDIARTDQGGHFVLPEVQVRRRLIDWLPSSTRATQTFDAIIDGETVRLMSVTSSVLNPSSATLGRPFVVMCRLDAEPTYGILGEGVCELIALPDGEDAAWAN